MADPGSIERRRAEAALEAVESLLKEYIEACKSHERCRDEERKQRIEKEKKELGKRNRMYVAYAKSLPATILVSGLGQAVATAMSRAGGDGEATGGGNREAWKALLRHLEDWLVRELAESPYHDPGAQENRPGLALMRKIVERDQDAYVAAQAEALAYLQWIKKFANALLEGDGSRETADAG